MIFRDDALTMLQWEFNGEQKTITTFSRTELTLDIGQPTESDAGEYFCVAYFSGGRINRVSGGFLNIYCKHLANIAFCVGGSHTQHYKITFLFTSR